MKLEYRVRTVCSSEDSDVTVQKARHLMIECSPLSKERPTVLQNLPLPLIMQHHINTVDVSRFLKTIFHMLQDQSKRDQIP